MYGTRIEKVNYQCCPSRNDSILTQDAGSMSCQRGVSIVSSEISRDGLVLASSVRSLGCMPVASYYSNYYRAVPHMGPMDNVGVAKLSPLFLEQRRSIPMELLRTACLHFQTPCTKEKGPHLTSLLPIIHPLDTSAERWYSSNPPTDELTPLHLSLSLLLQFQPSSLIEKHPVCGGTPLTPLDGKGGRSIDRALDYYSIPCITFPNYIPSSQ